MKCPTCKMGEMLMFIKGKLKSNFGSFLIFSSGSDGEITTVYKCSRPECDHEIE